MKKGKSLGRTVLFGGIVGLLFILSFVSYGISRNIRTNYKDTEVTILGKQDELNRATTDEAKAEIQAQIDDLNVTFNGYKNSYQGFAVAAYSLTIASLVSFGVCLAISDKIKEKEEEEAAKS